MTGLPSACSDHDSVAGKARNDKTMKEEQDSVADKARNDKTRKEEHDSVADKDRNDKTRKEEQVSVADKARNDKIERRIMKVLQTKLGMTRRRRRRNSPSSHRSPFHPTRHLHWHVLTSKSLLW